MRNSVGSASVSALPSKAIRYKTAKGCKPHSWSTPFIAEAGDYELSYLTSYIVIIYMARHFFVAKL